MNGARVSLTRLEMISASIFRHRKLGLADHVVRWKLNRAGFAGSFGA